MPTMRYDIPTIGGLLSRRGSWWSASSVLGIINTCQPPFTAAVARQATRALELLGLAEIACARCLLRSPSVDTLG